MPTYDYECENGHRFETFQSMKDEPLTECVDCGGKAKRLIGPGAGFLFKGDGFYVTEYRSKEYKEKAKAESGKSKPSDSGSSGRTGGPDAAGSTSGSGQTKRSKDSSSSSSSGSRKSGGGSSG
ncbi:MAG: FmdB family zinc ribbon protein [Candidatus Krumholzibacteriia bacterium]